MTCFQIIIIIDRFNSTVFIETTHESFDEPHQIHLVSWLPEAEPTRIVLISHGLHEHALRYHDLAHSLTSKGVAVYAFDHYAHGKSSGTKGFIPDYHYLILDFIEVAKRVRGNHAPEIPFSVISHSMGTLIAICSLNEIENVSSVVFSATPLFPGPDSSSPFGIRFLYPITKTAAATSIVKRMASLDPHGPAAPIAMSGLTNDVNEQNILIHDPYRYDAPICNKTAYEVTLMIAEAKTMLPKLQLPCLVIHGEEDTVALCTGSNFIFDNIGSHYKKLKVFPDSKHEMFHEIMSIKTESINHVVEFVCDNDYSVDNAV